MNAEWTLKLRHRRKPDTRGFTLIEMAVVIVIAGILISIAAGVLPSLIASAKIKQAKALLERADNALQGYALARHRLPYADGDGDGAEDAGVFIGALPYQTLGLPFQNDVWGNPIKYAVYGGGTVSTADLCQTFADTNAFCAEISNAIASAFDAGIGHILNDGTCPAPTSTNASNQAYLLASPGLKNMDGAAGKYDGCNAAGGATFSLPDAVLTDTYDDLVRALSLVELNLDNCTGSGPSGGGTATEVCDDAAAADEDGDGLSNCNDPDCASNPACSAASLSITTSTLPSGTLGSSYMTTVGASGGSTPYTWSLPAGGGFSDLGINSGTGTLTGTLDQCPGDYTIGVQVQDTTSPTVQSDAANLTLTVTSDLALSGSTNLNWSSPTQQESYSASGARLGDISWTLSTGGATGFEAVSTGSASCVIRKNGSTTPGNYVFTLSGTDDTCATNSASLTINVYVPASGGAAPGLISGVVDSLEFDATAGANPDILHIAGDVYAIASTGSGDDGYLYTVQIGSDGQISAAPIDVLEFDHNNGVDPDLIHVGGNIYAIAYTGRWNHGLLTTVTIADDGQIANSTIDTLEFNNNHCYEPDIIPISADIFAISYTGPDNDGFIQTVQIDSSGQISNTIFDTLEFDTAQAYEADWIHIAGDTYAIAYAGAGAVSDGFLCTVTIDSSGQISNSVIDRIEFDTGLCYDPDIIRISGGIYAIAYRGPGDDGFIKTVQIADDGTISGTVIDTLEFDATQCNEPVIAAVGGDVFAVAYRGPANDGFFTTVQIDSSGQIGDSVLDSLTFDANSGYEPSIVSLGGGVFAIAYRGPNGDGYVITISLQ
ncbi:MAG: prepilin-type N-terminal cleavage/methylation domain-containing protein [Desulfosarcinaceae bacterium]